MGYPRFILHRNPKRYDEYGYELEDDDEDEEADAEVAERNPYNEVSIERRAPILKAWLGSLII